jgi:RNA polymerase sigma factor (sigma-70 family)
MVDPEESFFNEVYERNYIRIIKYIVSKCRYIADVQDITQDVFSEFYALIRKRGIGYVQSPDALLIKIAKVKLYRYYSLIDRLKIAFPGGREEAPEGESLDIEDKEISDRMMNTLITSEIWDILKNKSESVKKAMYLYYYCGATLKETSEILGLGESDVKHKIYRTLQEIRNVYKESE